MANTITWKEVLNTSKKCSEGILACSEMVTPGYDRTLLPSFVEPAVLGRWLYGSSKEFLREFTDLSDKYLAQNDIPADELFANREQINEIKSTLVNNVSILRLQLGYKFAHKDRQLLGALAA